MYHVISPFQLFRMKTLHLCIKGQKYVFHFPAVSDVGGEILFRLRILILFGFLFWLLRARDRLVALHVSGALQQGFCWGFNLLRGWACIASFCD
jgi:hypothetical protein